MADVALAPEDLAQVRELGRELARAYREMTAYSREHPEVVELDGSDQSDDYAVRLPSDQVSWWGLSTLAERDPEQSQVIWRRVCQEARDELTSGNRAERVLTFEGTPWERARFLALRDSFRREWHPRGGIEDALIDGAAQAFTVWQEWLGRLNTRSRLEWTDEQAKNDEERRWLPLRVSAYQDLEQCAAMAERFYRVFLRSVRALRDLRRYPVVVQNAGQVNVGAQQVNVATVDR
jgi:hypothetical protein